MKQISLTKGKVAIVDDQDFDWLNQWKWYYRDSGFGGYAGRADYSSGKQQIIRMHREILELPRVCNDGLLVDHINLDKCDNRRSNLRIANRHQNQWNKGLLKANKSGYKGVHKSKCSRNKPWKAAIRVMGKQRTIGYFHTPEEAARAYNKAALEGFGEFAFLNPV